MGDMLDFDGKTLDEEGLDSAMMLGVATLLGIATLIGIAIGFGLALLLT